MKLSDTVNSLDKDDDVVTLIPGANDNVTNNENSASKNTNRYEAKITGSNIEFKLVSDKIYSEKGSVQVDGKQIELLKYRINDDTFDSTTKREDDSSLITNKNRVKTVNYADTDTFNVSIPDDGNSKVKSLVNDNIPTLDTIRIDMDNSDNTIALHSEIIITMDGYMVLGK